MEELKQEGEELVVQQEITPKAREVETASFPNMENSQEVAQVEESVKVEEVIHE